MLPLGHNKVFGVVFLVDLDIFSGGPSGRPASRLDVGAQRAPRLLVNATFGDWGWYYGISTTAGGGVLGRLRSSTPSPSPSPTRRSRVGLGLGRGVLELKLHEVPTTDSSQVR